MFSGYKIKLTKAITLLMLLIFVTYSCTSSNKEKDQEEFMDIYYFMGYIDTAMPCERDFDFSDISDHGMASVERNEYATIKKFINDLHHMEKDSSHSVQMMCLQCNLYHSHGKDSSKRLSIGQFGSVEVDGERFHRNDSLVYLLRKNSGFYNYYNKEDLVGFCPELKVFGIPDDYQDLSASLDINYHFFAKIRILAE